jgi:hypothetical protein
VLLRGLLCELKLKAIGEIGEPLQEAVCRWLLNDRLMNSIAAILLEKTNLYNSR